MVMEHAESILVIITSSVLVIFLLLAIATAIYIMKVVKQVKRVVVKAEEVVDTAEAAAEAVRQVDGPLAALKLLRNIVRLVDKHQQRKK